MKTWKPYRLVVLVISLMMGIAAAFLGCKGAPEGTDYSDVPPLECATYEDCGTGSDCRTWQCIVGKCVAEDVGWGVEVDVLNVVGDCKTWVCDGRGEIILVEDPTDTYWENVDCFESGCNGSTPVTKVLLGNACVMQGGSVGICDQAGACVQCLTDKQCHGWASWTCQAGVCVRCGDIDGNGDEICGGSCGKCVGEVCFGDKDCAGDACVATNLQSPDPSNVCCNESCNGVCERCSIAGTCELVPKGEPDHPNCNAPGLGCLNGVCKFQVGYWCVEDSHCVSGLCVASRCQCVDDSDCVHSGYCEGGACKCTTDADCDGGHCNSGTCES